MTIHSTLYHHSHEQYEQYSQLCTNLSHWDYDPDVKLGLMQADAL